VRRAGFTLIEVLAVIFLTALVVGVALNFFVDMSNQSAMASESTRELRRATSLLDRIARDLERVLLVRKAKDADPLAHPWIFLAEPKLAEDGADQLKFMLRADPPRMLNGPVSDLQTVAYTLERSAEGRGFELHRWTSPQLPERLDRTFPAPDDPASLLVADGLAHFAVRFLGEGGEWVDRWDSSQLVDSSELPFAVEIEVGLLPENGEEPETQDGEPALYSRRVLLPMRPLDLVALLDPSQAARAAGNGDDEKDGKCKYTVADCIDWSMVGGGGGAGAGGGAAGGLPAGINPADLAALGDLVANAPTICWDDYRALYGSHPAVRDFCR
jgi:prepilin-type N-terminal cleavage/methylation domain-containing protein